jgi:predicted nucleic acid-binding protein
MVETVILDACCTLNLSATGRAEEILRRLPYHCCVGERARGEAQWLAIPDSEERELVDLRSLIDLGLLAQEELCGSAEEALFVAFGISLADGEAEAAALAVNRGYILATDDRKARRIVTEKHPALRLAGTLELIREWQQTAAPAEAEVAEALRRIADRATYRPRRSDPLYGWWAALTGR